MAMLIKKAYNLAGLKVSLVTGGSDATIRLEFEVTESHNPYTIRSWEVEASQFGLPPRFDPDKVLYQGYQFRLPQQIQQELREELNKLDHPGTIWLHLVKPYGYLGIVPWEELLIEAVPHPILRLPDVWCDPPTEIPSTLDVALCASEPVADTPFNVEQNLIGITEHLLKVPRSHVRVDIFTDLRYAGRLESYWAGQGELNTRVFVHDPASAASYAIPRKSLEIRSVPEIESPWLLWMREALQGRSVDLVHFQGHGYFSGTKGALGFAESPMLNQDASWCRFVGSDELNLFLRQVGAWSVAIDSPIGNYSEMGLRAVADDLAQRRPGPTLHHESRLDRTDLFELNQAFLFLFNRELIHPAITRSIALCCQPFRVAGYKQQALELEGIRTLESESLAFRATALGDPSSEENVPAWIAATQRYVEQKQFEVNQVRKTTAARRLARTSAQTAGVERGLDEIKQAIALMAQKSRVKL
ncbi:MAG: hypothetical protein WCA10_24720 [Terracidiphilus sp.]